MKVRLTVSTFHIMEDICAELGKEIDRLYFGRIDELPSISVSLAQIYDKLSDYLDEADVIEE